MREKKKVAFLGQTTLIDEFLSGRQDLYERLEKLVSESAPQNEIIKIIGNLR